MISLLETPRNFFVAFEDKSQLFKNPKISLKTLEIPENVPLAATIHLKHALLQTIYPNENN